MCESRGRALALDCKTVRQRRFTYSLRLARPARKLPTRSCTLTLLPKHRFPVASSLPQPQDSLIRIKVRTLMRQIPQPQVQPRRAQVFPTAAPLVSLPKGAGALSQITFQPTVMLLPQLSPRANQPSCRGRDGRRFRKPCARGCRFGRSRGSWGSTEPPSRNTWMPTVLQGGGPGLFSLRQHPIQWRHNKVTFMLNT